MTKTELRGYQRQLLTLGKRVKGHVSTLTHDALRKTGGEASGILSNTPIHLADLSSDSFEQEVALSLLENEQHQVEEIAAALDRIRCGTFGRCEECQKVIAKERLQALPYARLCINCARQGQPAGRGSR
jgi:RNA polymerase-binding transcription factor DksA